MPIEALQVLQSALAISLLAILVLVTKSLLDFTRAGPQVRGEVLAHFRYYLLYALGRLVLLGWLVLMFWSTLGGALHVAVLSLAGAPFSLPLCALAGMAMTGAATALAFCEQLLHKPGNICASWQYRMSRLYGLWHWLTPGRVRSLRLMFWGGTGALLAAGAAAALLRGEWPRLALLAGFGAVIAAYFGWRRRLETVPAPEPLKTPADRPNLVLIGSDTLRVDHLGVAGYARPTSPYLDRLCRRSAFFSACYTPLARTAPSLACLFSGVWPHQHGVRDNFTPVSESRVPRDTLAGILGRLGYRTCALGDWCGSDLGKFGFGFGEVECPDDQWNLKYYLRQGPMLLRLFLSLFFNNPLGRRLLPEIYYQAGNPLETPLGIRARQKIHEFGQAGRPFFINLFMGTNHAPFGSEYPHYLEFADRNYAGHSKFVMTTFSDPNEIIEKQELRPENFDLDQIVRLYDGCTLRFDAEVARIAGYLEACGLADNTLLVIYSDHGIEFFENQSWGQGNTVLGDDYGAKIPLIIHDPRNPVAIRVDGITRMIDVAPTLLELCGAEVPPSMSGVSLARAMRGEPCPALTAYQETGVWFGKIPGLQPGHLGYPNLLELLEIPDKKLASMAIKPEYLPLVNRAKDRMVRRGRWKLVYQPLETGPLLRLFDMATDPACRRDLSAQHPEILAGLREELAVWLRADGIECDPAGSAALTAGIPAGRAGSG